MAKGVLVDISKCIGCGSCVVACKMYNNNKWIEERHPKPAAATGAHAKLADENWTVVRTCRLNNESNDLIHPDLPIRTDGSETWRYVKEQCYHCKDPACVSSCFATAFKKSEDGSVGYYPNLCVGCRYCMLACPFNIPKFQWENPLPMLTKCSMCSDRIAKGDAPTCVSVCPTNVMKFGECGDLLREAKQLLSAHDSTYVQHIYGEKEAGGTNWIYISDKPFEKLGFKMNVPNRSIPDYTRGFMYKTPFVGVIWAAILTCLYIVTGQMAKNKKGSKPADKLTNNKSVSES